MKSGEQIMFDITSFWASTFHLLTSPMFERWGHRLMCLCDRHICSHGSEYNSDGIHSTIHSPTSSSSSSSWSWCWAQAQCSRGKPCRKPCSDLACLLWTQTTVLSCKMSTFLTPWSQWTVTSAFNNTLNLSWAETAACWPLCYVTSLMRLDYAHSCEPAANLWQSWFTMFGLLFPLTTTQHLYIHRFLSRYLVKVTLHHLETSRNISNNSDEQLQFVSQIN